MTAREKIHRYGQLHGLFTAAFHVAIRSRSAAERCRANGRLHRLVPDLAEALADIVGDGEEKTEEVQPATQDDSMAAFEAEVKPVKTRKPYVRQDHGYCIPTYHGTGHERGSHVSEE